MVVRIVGLVLRRCGRCCTLCNVLRLLVLSPLLMFICFLLYPVIAPPEMNKALGRCMDQEKRQFLRELCRNFSESIISGPLCRPLCVTEEIVYKKCLGHGGKIVIESQYGDQPVILKAAKHSIFQFQFPFDLQNGRVPNHLIETYMPSIYFPLKRAVSPFPVSEEVIKKKLLSKLPKNITSADFLSLSSVLAQDEFVRLLLLSGNKHIPALYGWCGHVYAMEYIPTGDMMKVINFHGPQSWVERAKVALSFLDMLKSLKETPYGELSLCDIQEANFGVSPDLNVFAIDIDLTFFRKELTDIIIQPKCKTDKDCEFFDCVSFCDTASGNCTQEIKTNNFQNVCRDVFMPKMLGLSGLLGQAPTKIIAGQLNIILNSCSEVSVSRRSPLSSQHYEILFNELHDFLLKLI
eukprot:m.86992 g.86992  ORF g.86992 m.86992 type:complete len:407 (+) comp36525_c0_seq2:365-1585(+)